MLLRVKIKANPSVRNSIEVDLPTFTMVEAVPDALDRVIVDVPETDLPIAHPSWLGISHTLDRGHNVIVAMPPAVLARWRSHLDNRYREHEGEYRVEVE